MMDNIARAGELILGRTAPAAALALADATPTLLMPDLPEPDSGGIWEGEGGSWVVSPLQGGVCAHVYEDLTPDEARGLALALLAAADYSEGVGTDGQDD